MVVELTGEVKTKISIVVLLAGSTGFDLTNGKCHRFLSKVYQGDIRIARMIDTG